MMWKKPKHEREKWETENREKKGRGRGKVGKTRMGGLKGRVRQSGQRREKGNCKKGHVRKGLLKPIGKRGGGCGRGVMGREKHPTAV